VTESALSAVRGRRWPGAGLFFRVGRRTLAESLYLLSAPVTAAAGLLLVSGGLCAGAVGLLVPGESRAMAGALALVRWPADVERWRIAKVRMLTAGADDAGRRPGPREAADASGPGLWLDMAHAVAVLPVVLATWAATGVWWFIGVAFLSFPLRSHYTAGTLRPQSMSAGPLTVTVGLTSPDGRLAFVITTGLLLMISLPLVTRACTAAQAGLGQVLLFDVSPLYRRIRGLEQERDTARAQTVAAVTAEAAALRRLERDIHDGPQQRLVCLAMELGRAERHFDSRPEAAREALADAIASAQDALDELRALSRGIAPPVLVDRGLREALTALVARSTVPAELDAGPVGRRLDAAVETAAYFVVAEALTNVAKHSHARRCVVGLRHGGGTLRAWVTDDGTGGAALGKGHGLQGLADRLNAIGGQLMVTSPHGGPTTITAELPCR
jgi:signal transduction histidine kinase